MVPEGDSGVSGVGESEEMIPDAHNLLDLLSLDVDQENLEEKSADDGGRAISAGEELDEGPQELWRDPEEELQTAINIQPGWPEITSDLGARSLAGPPMPPTSWMRRPVEGEDGAMAWRLRERRPCGDHQVPGQQPEKHQRLDQERGRRDPLTRMDGHQKAERQEDRGVPGQQLEEHKRLDQGKGRRDRLGRDDDLQRAIELQVVEELRKQNEELRNEVKALNEKIAQGQYHRGQTPTPRTPTTAMFTPMEQPAQVRRTPGGTQVPPGTPPQTLEEPRGELPEIPPWPWSKFEHGRSAEEWSNWEGRQRERHEQGREVHEWTHGRLSATGNPRRDECGGGGHRQGGPDRGVYPRRHELHDGERREELGSAPRSMEAEHGRWTGLHGGWASNDGPSRFQAARLQWLERELRELKSRVRTHETKSGGHGVPAWHQADGLWMQADAQQLGPDCIPPPPPMLIEEKEPEGEKANFDWGANNPEVLIKEEMKDDLRAINVTLPKLPDENTPQAALRCGDWITEIEPLIGDVSGGAARWWTQLMVEVNAVYKVWLSSDALTRLEVDVQVKPNATRLEGRVTSMLLAALPSSIKSDIIANTKLTAASIMLEVMKRFQPGGLGEKSGLLRALTAPETATSPAHGVEKLRLWSRNVARAVELGVTLPDPVLQIGALDSICRQILNKEPQINFRVQYCQRS